MFPDIQLNNAVSLSGVSLAKELVTAAESTPRLHVNKRMEECFVHQALASSLRRLDGKALFSKADTFPSSEITTKISRPDLSALLMAICVTPSAAPARTWPCCFTYSLSLI